VDARAGSPARAGDEAMTETTTKKTRVRLAAAVAVVAVLAAGAGNAAAATDQAQQATAHCWLQVINDWLAHQPNVKGTYAKPCYTQAIQHLNLYPDVKGYSSAADDIQNAMLAAIRRGGGSGPPSSGPGVSPGSKSGPGTKTPASASSSGQADHKRGAFAWLGDHLAPGNAQSVPLPLIVLGGLAVLLLLAAGGTWLARRMQARRVTPAPAPAPRR
jgi:hypothetical protein